MKKLIDKGLRDSPCYGISLFYKSNNFYVMDNHGGALWAWIQHLNTSQSYRLIHIDKHYDTLDTNIDIWMNSLPENLSELSIEEYFSIQCDIENVKYQTIRWDNYIPIFDKLYGENIRSYIFFTHRKGNTKTKALDQNKVQEFQHNSLITNLERLIKEFEGKTILNLDVDYFFLDNGNKYIQRYSDNEINKFFEIIQDCYIRTNKLEVITVALSPECCGGWNNSLRVYNKLAKHLGLDIINERITEE